MTVELDTTIALIDEDEYIAYAGLDTENPKLPTDQIIAAINQVSVMINRHCDRTFVIPATQIQEIFDGDGTKDYYTKHGRIGDTAPAADIKIYLWQSTSWVEKTATDMPRAVDAEKGRVWFNQGHTFYEGEDNWRIDYKPGWALTAIPADLKGVCKAGVQRLLMIAGGKEGFVTESFGEATHTYNLNEILGVKEKSILNGYKRRFL
jgi:hypothetical protein